MLLYSKNYDSRNFDPAAPVVEVTVRPSPTSTKGIKLTALIDSGADSTLLPKDVLTQIGAEYLRSASMRGILDQPVPLTLHAVAIEIGSETLTGIRAIALPKGSMPILG